MYNPERLCFYAVVLYNKYLIDAAGTNRRYFFVKKTPQIYIRSVSITKRI